MTFINLMAREINCKIVYYGPGLCGKTTNLELIYNRTKPDAKGKMVSLATETDRTLFFDFLPIELGEIRGFKTRFHLYTVPGQVFYDASRKLILKGVDGCVFVADSQIARADANEESLENLKENLAEYGMNLDEIPYVIQYNKRDLPAIMEVDELRSLLNPDGVPDFEAVASEGRGVFETLKAVARLVFMELKKSGSAGLGGPSGGSGGGAGPARGLGGSGRAPAGGGGGTPSRSPAQRPPEQRPPEQRPPEQRPPEQRPPEQRPPEQRPPQQRPPGGGPPGQRPGQRPGGGGPPGGPSRPPLRRGPGGGSGPKGPPPPPPRQR